MKTGIASHSLSTGLSSKLGGIRWLLRDDFTTALPAGSVNGTAAEPGPGTRVVYDSGTYSRKLVANSNGDALGQYVAGTIPQRWHRVSAWVYLESGASITIQDYSQGAWVYWIITTGAWQHAKATYYMGNHGSFFTLRSFVDTPVTAYIDDADVVLIDRAERGQ